MSNNDRIKNWRARRGTAGYVVGAGAADQVRAVETQAAPAPEAPDQATLLRSVIGPLDAGTQAAGAHEATPLSHVLGALRSSASDSVAARRAVFEALQAQFARQANEAALPADETDFGVRRLRNTSNLVESDIRAGRDVHAEAYAPATLAADDARLAAAFAKRVQRRVERRAQEERRRASRDDVVLAVQLAPDEAADLATLRERMALLHARQSEPAPGMERSRLSSLLSLVIFQVHALQAESRFALVWALFGPAVLLSLISAMYFLSGTHYILGMDVASFSLTGATTWIMFRQIIFRSSTSYIAARGLLNLQGITPLATALAQATIYLGVYMIVFCLLITAGYNIGLISLPENGPVFALYVAAMGASGAAVGILFGAIATRWHYFLRLAPVIERAIEIFSSVFFVSEQLPERYRDYVLWSPFAHGMQLLRSAYFGSYRSTDASLSYFLTAMVFLAAAALLAERFARRRVQPM
jgi:capsular polysaccharide transport system permease protein